MSMSQKAYSGRKQSHYKKQKRIRAKHSYSALHNSEGVLGRMGDVVFLPNEFSVKHQSDLWFFDERTSQFLTVLSLPVENESGTGIA